MLLVICRRSWWSSPGIYSCPSPRTQRNRKRMRRRVNLVELPFWLLSHANNVSHQISHNVNERPGSWGPAQTLWGYWLMLYLCLSSNCVYSCVTILANTTLEKREDLWYHYPRGAALHWWFLIGHAGRLCRAQWARRAIQESLGELFLTAYVCFCFFASQHPEILITDFDLEEENSLCCCWEITA